MNHFLAWTKHIYQQCDHRPPENREKKLSGMILKSPFLMTSARPRLSAALSLSVSSVRRSRLIWTWCQIRQRGTWKPNIPSERNLANFKRALEGNQKQQDSWTAWTHLIRWRRQNELLQSKKFHVMLSKMPIYNNTVKRITENMPNDVGFFFSQTWIYMYALRVYLGLFSVPNKLCIFKAQW